MVYFDAIRRNVYYGMIAIAGRFDEIVAGVGFRGRVMADNQGYSDAEGIPPDVSARFAMIEARIERPLTEEQSAQVKHRIARSIALGVALRAYPLTNADEPEIALIPYRGGDR